MLEILLLNVVQSDAERRPRESDDAVGMFSVCTPFADEKPKPPLTDVVANVCVGEVRPLSEYNRPRDDVAVSV